MFDDTLWQRENANGGIYLYYQKTGGCSVFPAFSKRSTPQSKNCDFHILAPDIGSLRKKKKK